VSITVTRRHRATSAIAVVTLVGFAAWSARHVVGVLDALQGRGSQFGLLFTAGFAFIAVDWHEREVLDRLHVTVPVPVYNEDPELLRRCLWSLLAQDRRPNLIFVVDDGSTKVNYDMLQGEFARAAASVGVQFRWLRTPNQGKRHAQGVAFARTPMTDIYVTIDSDALLGPSSIRELLRPFRSEDVMSVAGVVLASNVDKNLLTRFTDLWFVTAQLVTRSGLSSLGSVLVNSGPLAAYRGAVVRDNLDGYLNETFLGRPVKFSDDSMLTLYAKMRGKTVQQPSAVVLSAMPESVSHHLRQYVRWMRGSTIRSCWRFRYLPMNSAAFWLHAATWLQMIVSTLLMVTLFVVAPLTGVVLTPHMLSITVLIALAQVLRYTTYQRSDVSTASHLLTLATFPIAALWAFFVLRGVRWYGMATCLKTGWGTRQDVEVRAELVPTAA
jgi:hyaluronan synthase